MNSVSERISLEDLNYDRIDDMYEYSQDEEFYKYLGSISHKTKNDTKNYLDFLFSRINDNNIKNKYWFIKLNSIDKVIGTVGLVNITEENAELAYGIGTKYIGHGFTHEVVLLMCDYVFNVLKLDRLYGGTNINNTPVIKTLLSLGFTENKNKTNDTHWYYEMERKFFIEHDNLIKNDPKNVCMSDIIKIVSSIVEEEINESTKIDDCLNWDSLNHIDIIEELSHTYCVKFTPKDVVTAISISKIYEIIKEKYE